jgi:recombination protein RecA
MHRVPQPIGGVDDLRSDLRASTTKCVGRNIVITTRYMPTGCLVLDVALNGGYREGRLYEVFGDESTGKSMLAMYALRQAQIEGGLAVLIETEGTCSVDLAEDVIGLDWDAVELFQPDTVEEVFRIISCVIKAGQAHPDKLIVMVWDTVAATSTEAEKKGDFGDCNIGTHALLLSQGLRKTCRALNRQGRIISILVNQARTDINVRFGRRVRTMGGGAVKFHATGRILLTDTSMIKDPAGGDPLGEIIRAEVLKNKLGPPHARAVFPMIYRGPRLGIDEDGSIYMWLEDRLIVQGRGGRMHFPDALGWPSFLRKDWTDYLAERRAAIIDFMWRYKPSSDGFVMAAQ